MITRKQRETAVIVAFATFTFAFRRGGDTSALSTAQKLEKVGERQKFGTRCKEPPLRF